jgi:hypothetical protein
MMMSAGKRPGCAADDVSAQLPPVPPPLPCWTVLTLPPWLIATPPEPPCAVPLPVPLEPLELLEPPPEEHACMVATPTRTTPTSPPVPRKLDPMEPRVHPLQGFD